MYGCVRYLGRFPQEVRIHRRKPTNAEWAEFCYMVEILQERERSFFEEVTKAVYRSAGAKGI